MLNIPQELANIHGLIHKAYYQCGSLKTIVLDNGVASPQFCGELDKLVSGLEQTVMRARYLGEISYRDVQPLEKTAPDYEKHSADVLAGGLSGIREYAGGLGGFSGFPFLNGGAAG